MCACGNALCQTRCPKNAFLDGWDSPTIQNEIPLDEFAYTYHTGSTTPVYHYSAVGRASDYNAGARGFGSGDSPISSKVFVDVHYEDDIFLLATAPFSSLFVGCKGKISIKIKIGELYNNGPEKIFLTKSGTKTVKKGGFENG